MSIRKKGWSVYARIAALKTRRINAEDKKARAEKKKSKSPRTAPDMPEEQL